MGERLCGACVCVMHTCPCVPGNVSLSEMADVSSSNISSSGFKRQIFILKCGFLGVSTGEAEVFLQLV